MKALDEYFLMLLFALLLIRVYFLTMFCLIWAAIIIIAVVGGSPVDSTQSSVGPEEAARKSQLQNVSKRWEVIGWHKKTRKRSRNVSAGNKLWRTHSYGGKTPLHTTRHTALHISDWLGYFMAWDKRRCYVVPVWGLFECCIHPGKLSLQWHADLLSAYWTWSFYQRLMCQKSFSFQRKGSSSSSNNNNNNNNNSNSNSNSNNNNNNRITKNSDGENRDRITEVKPNLSITITVAEKKTTITIKTKGIAGIRNYCRKILCPV